MSRVQSTAPKERVNIVYRPAHSEKEEVELPLKILMVGDYIGQKDLRPMEDRKPVQIDKENFNEVLAAHQVHLDLNVPNRLDPRCEGTEINLHLNFQSMRDFEPDQLIGQVSELAALLEIRQALSALKGPLGNMPVFRKRVQGILQDPARLAALYQELGLAFSQEEGK